MKSYKFTDYTYLEIKDFVDAGCLAIVPTGGTEQQGLHLPIDFDTWFAETVALAAAKYTARFHQVRALVLPAKFHLAQHRNIKGTDRGMSISRIQFMKNTSILSLCRSRNRDSEPSLSGGDAASISYMGQ